jgi:lipopolysaccharide transport system ATP-binding protein
MSASILAQDVSLDFPLYHVNARSIRQTVMRTITGKLGEDAQHRVVVKALQNIDFQLRPGDRLGLVGSNGAGKSTLLRTLAGIYEPSQGRVFVRGTFNALLDPNLGMNTELTGAENIRLRGLYHGLSRPAIRRLHDDVAEFANLGDFLRMPVRIYSSGMIIRLGFGLATAIRPQVLLMDEWFLAGDANFMGKAKARLEDMVRGAEILVLSTHNAAVIHDWCTRVIWMQQGRIQMDGTPKEVMPAYLGPTEIKRRKRRGLTFHKAANWQAPARRVMSSVS